MIDDQLQNIMSFLENLKEDSTVPRNVKVKITEVNEILKTDIEKCLKIDKAMHIFDELSDDSNIDSFTRTQLWNVVSMLEAV